MGTRYAYEIADNSPGFVASVNSLWAELNGAGAVTLRYLTVGDETVARSDGANLYWLLADRMGSTRDVTNAAGTFVDHVEYTTFGGLLSESNPAVSGNVLFTGGLFDRLTGLYGMHWRTYDPQSGQWTSEDPLGFGAGDMNQRRYVGNGATNGVDRNGLEEQPSRWSIYLRAFAESCITNPLVASLAPETFKRAADGFERRMIDAHETVGSISSTLMPLHFEVAQRVFRDALVPGATAKSADEQIVRLIALKNLDVQMVVGAVVENQKDTAAVIKLVTTGESGDLAERGGARLFDVGVLVATDGVLRVVPKVGSLQASSQAKTTTLYRGTNGGAALEIVETQKFDVARIKKLQQLTTQEREGVFVTTQESTAQFYADIAGMHGRGLGPKIVRIEVPTSKLNALAKKHGIPLETPVSRLPGQTETLLPFETVSEFESFSKFFLHK